MTDKNPYREQHDRRMNVDPTSAVLLAGWCLHGNLVGCNLCPKVVSSLQPGESS